MKKRWQIGIVRSIHPHDICWLNDFVDAETKGEAEALADERGYQRNLRVQEVANSTSSEIIEVTQQAGLGH